jgi:nucleoside-diphosphate-sugar epimerase
MNKIQTILGSGGSLGIELAKALIIYSDSIRLVSRNPKRINENDHLFPADLTIESEVKKAIEGSEIVYLMAGFKYDLKTWRNTWPKVMRMVIDACIEYNAKLVFLDNIYMYDKDHLNPMTEETPVNPPSKKGQVRAQIAQMLMDEIKAGRINGLIARSADFYGPSIKHNSVLTETVFKPLSENKKANWLISVDYKHSFTYTPDAGRATALLGNTPDAFNQVWHLPTAPDPYTGKVWIKKIATTMGKEGKFMLAPKFLIRIMGLFMPIMKEIVEMTYQNDRDYVFDSSKFESKFDFKPTSYEDGIRQIIETDYRNE